MVYRIVLTSSFEDFLLQHNPECTEMYSAFEAYFPNEALKRGRLGFLKPGVMQLLVALPCSIASLCFFLNSHDCRRPNLTLRGQDGSHHNPSPQEDDCESEKKGTTNECRFRM